MCFFFFNYFTLCSGYNQFPFYLQEKHQIAEGMRSTNIRRCHGVLKECSRKTSRRRNVNTKHPNLIAIIDFQSYQDEIRFSFKVWPCWILYFHLRIQTKNMFCEKTCFFLYSEIFTYKSWQYWIIFTPCFYIIFFFVIYFIILSNELWNHFCVFAIFVYVFLMFWCDLYFIVCVITTKCVRL